MRLATDLTRLPQLPELIDGVPCISGWEEEVQAVVQRQESVFLPITNTRMDQVSAAFSIALHMHQPTIPAGFQGELIGNLQYMFEHPTRETIMTPDPSPIATPAWQT